MDLRCRSQAGRGCNHQGCNQHLFQAPLGAGEAPLQRNRSLQHSLALHRYGIDSCRFLRDDGLVVVAKTFYCTLLNGIASVSKFV